MEIQTLQQMMESLLVMVLVVSGALVMIKYLDDWVVGVVVFVL